LTDRADVLAGIRLWNDRHPDFAIDDRLVEQNVYAPFDGLDVTAWGSFAGDGSDGDPGDLIGFALTKTFVREIPDYAGPEQGWVSLLAVDSEVADPGAVAHDLLATVEADLAATGVETLRFGGDPGNFLAGLPTELADDYRPFLADAGFEPQRTVYDLAGEITSFEPPERVERVRNQKDDLAVERVALARADDLLGFLDDQFPGRWRYEAENIDRIPGGISDYWVLRYAGSVVGFARTNAPDSPFRGPNANWGWRLGERFGGLGPLGIHEEYRGRGWGFFMQSEILEALRDDGFEHVVIDWTTLVDYYGKLGFEPWLAYETFVKEL
jgi:GNAT superfamily N-acetyltransferase